jgi:hypothetical protein
MNAATMQDVNPISLVLPGKPEYIGLCRLVAGVVGARESLDEESIADLKLAVTEACTCFLWGPEGDVTADGPAEAATESFRVDFRVAPEAWEITVSDPQHRRLGTCAATGQDSLGLTVMSALVDSMERTETDVEGSVIRLVKRFPSPPGYD